MPTKPLFVLIADDDMEDAELFKEIILAIEPGIQITHVVNGQEAINVLKKIGDSELPNILVLDYNMPQMTGLEVLSALYSKTRYNSIVKFILSTSSSKHHKKQCIDQGAKEYFVKPGNIKELQALTKKILSSAK